MMPWGQRRFLNPPGGSITVGSSTSSSLRPTYGGSKNLSTPAVCSGRGVGGGGGGGGYSSSEKPKGGSVCLGTPRRVGR